MAEATPVELAPEPVPFVRAGERRYFPHPEGGDGAILEFDGTEWVPLPAVTGDGSVADLDVDPRHALVTVLVSALRVAIVNDGRITQAVRTALDQLDTYDRSMGERKAVPA